MSKMLRNVIPRKENGKIDFMPRKHHGWTGFIFLLGYLFPPLAVAARFGFGKDFAVNLFLTICGYFPGHGHNFFVQNIRNNDNNKRTPKWAVRYGLVDDSAAKRLAKKRQWVGRYNDRLPQRTMYDDEGLAWSYGTHHKVDDRDDAEALPAGAASRSQTGLVDPDQWMNEDHAEQGGRGRDPYSLRRTRSDHSLASVAASEYQHSSAGAGAQRSKSRSRLFGGGKKTSRGAADRHARSDWVMGNPDNRLDPSMARRGDVGYYDGYGYGYASRESLRSVSTPSAGAGRSAGSRADAESFEGPEDADDNYGRRYRRTGAGAGAGAGGRQLNGGGRAGGGKDLPLPPQAHRDVMDVHHEF